ncbi:hypothetical protein [Marinobacter sp.]|uniref:hypothetical protein n=1 Tax=Marinobacter sp. TaxID=50741 RepID=UPI00384F85E6
MSDPQITLQRAVAFGDSVVWGQGLQHADKFTTLIARRTGGIDMPRNAMLAHSGAVLEQENNSGAPDVDPAEDAPVYGEIPRGRPSIFRQVATFGLPLPLNRVADERLPDVTFPETEIVFVNGGLNDIDAGELVSGDLGGLAQIEQRIRRLYRDRFLDLLRLVRQRFPAARIFVFGYHFIFSQDSLSRLIDTAEVVIGEDSQLARTARRGIRQCSWFMSLSAAALQAAVDALNADEAQSMRAIFVPSLQGPQHAGFAADTMSWGLRESGEAAPGRPRQVENLLLWNFFELSGLSSNDQVTALREAHCDAYAVDVRGGLGKDIEADAQCQLAALFHPDERGARRIADIAEHAHAGVSAPPSLRDALAPGERSLLRFSSRLGFEPRFSYRSLFATDLLAAIRLDGIIDQGTHGEFPYHLLYIELDVAERPEPVRYPLNDGLPFTSGFADRDDYVFPGAYGERSGEGGFFRVRDIQEETPFNFFAFPTDVISLSDVLEIRIGAHGENLERALHLKELGLEINGRRIPLSDKAPTFRTGGLEVIVRI